MKKEMLNVIVTADDEKIVITQPYSMGDDGIVELHPDQVDTLIKWLKEAKAEYEDNTKE